MTTTAPNGKSNEELWRHSAPESTSMWKFLTLINEKHKLDLKTYDDLYRWSVDNIAAFWSEVWHFTGVRASQPFDTVVDEKAPMYPRPSFFSGAKLNFAENLLFPPHEPDPESTAIIAATEVDREVISWAELRLRVAKCKAGLEAVGLKEGDRVAGYVGNHTESVVAMLATTAIGAVWTGISPDSGVHMVLDRLRQIEPVVLFADSSQFYNGKKFDVLPKVADIVKELPSLQTVVKFGSKHVIPTQKNFKFSDEIVYPYEKFLKLGGPTPKLTFNQLPPDHPVYVLFSSGTTGKPKCIIHGAIGTLIQHKKEHVLHCSVLPGQRFFYFTTCTWMMWHWLVSGLSAGAVIILYDGSPLRYKSTENPETSVADDLAMPRLIDELEIEHFGTSAKYLSVLEQKEVLPKNNGITLKSLQAIYNTASPLAPSTFRYVYRAFGPDINLGSITGGTDIVSLFGAACPLTPVYAGEVQVPGLAMAIRAWDEEGKDVTASGEAGDLVCVRSFPCQPVSFWGADGAARYKSSYFERFPDIWHHGDFVEFNPKTGGLVMLGRSDGVLNPAGIRFGSAEVYNVLLKHFPGRIADGLCVGRKRAQDMDETVILFVKMEPGSKFDDQLRNEIKKVIRGELSPRHVPGMIDECPDIPFTVNGKKVEGEVKKIVSGLQVKTTASVANPDCLDFYRRWYDSVDESNAVNGMQALSVNGVKAAA